MNKIVIRNVFQSDSKLSVFENALEAMMTNLSEMNIYENIRTTVSEAQKKVYATVNFVMVETYWNIGKQICEVQGENDRAEYGSAY